jgi:hypothetical protein
VTFGFEPLRTRPNGLPDCVIQAGFSRAGFAVNGFQNI